MSHITGANEWRLDSMKGLCTKFQCYNKPRNQCSECSTSHIHTDTLQDLQKEK